jgi:hypothetical protein
VKSFAWGIVAIAGIALAACSSSGGTPGGNSTSSVTNEAHSTIASQPRSTHSPGSSGPASQSVTREHVSNNGHVRATQWPSAAQVAQIMARDMAPHLGLITVQIGTATKQDLACEYQPATSALVQDTVEFHPHGPSDDQGAFISRASARNYAAETAQPPYGKITSTPDIGPGTFYAYTLIKTAGFSEGDCTQYVIGLDGYPLEINVIARPNPVRQPLIKSSQRLEFAVGRRGLPRSYCDEGPLRLRVCRGQVVLGRFVCRSDRA